MATTHNYSYYIKKPCKNYHVLSVLGYFLIFERGILNYSASDKACHVHSQVSLSRKSIPPKQSATSLSREILNYWTMCHSLIPALLWCTTDNFKMAYETPLPHIILSISATIWCCNSQNLILELTHNIHMHLNTYRVYIKIYISGFTAICIDFSVKKGLRLNKK